MSIISGNLALLSVRCGKERFLYIKTLYRRMSHKKGKKKKIEGKKKKIDGES
ncbi:hypothetical protein ACSAZK_12760 [Methanosarcina sp. Mfa9]|uniref:hypothetical protein n=1 Tax=Methanosarcina sp. Mfa9 TaxID=3439063 RepID=UPI003F836563